MLQVTHTAAAPIAVGKGRARTVTALYADFESAHSTYRSIADEDEKAWSAALSKCTRLANRILATPAASIDEALLKVRVGLWGTAEFRYSQLEELDDWSPDRRPTLDITPGTTVIAALRDDLRRMKAARIKAAHGAPFAS